VRYPGSVPRRKKWNIVASEEDPLANDANFVGLLFHALITV
jgi:hypothetical protein